MYFPIYLTIHIPIGLEELNEPAANELCEVYDAVSACPSENSVLHDAEWGLNKVVCVATSIHLICSIAVSPPLPSLPKIGDIDGELAVSLEQRAANHASIPARTPLCSSPCTGTVPLAMITGISIITSMVPVLYQWVNHAVSTVPRVYVYLLLL